MKNLMLLGVLLAVVMLALAVGCSEGSGGEGEPCYPNGTCNGSLACLSNLCVDPGRDSGLREAGGPDAGLLDAARPDVFGVDQQVADGVLPDLMPDTVVPDASPDLLVPDLPVSDTVVSDLTVPDAAPDLVVPDLMMKPDLTVPDLIVPDAAPDLPVPDFPVPDQTVKPDTGLFSPSPYLSFGGLSGEVIVVKDDPKLHPGTGNFTVELWLRSDLENKVNNKANLFEKRDGSGANYYAIGIGKVNGNYKVLFTFVSSAGWVNYYMMLTPAQMAPWHHLAFQRSSGSVELYYNGKPQTVQTTLHSGTSNPSQHNINNKGTLVFGNTGQPSYQGAYPFKGDFGPARVSNKARYKGAFTPGSLVADSSTVLLYQMTEGKGKSLMDASGNGNTGTVTGCAWGK